MTYKIFADDDVRRSIEMPKAIEAIAEALRNYTHEFLLAGTPEFEHIKDLSDLVDGEFQRNENDISLFCSTGLAGTEVLVAATLFE